MACPRLGWGDSLAGIPEAAYRYQIKTDKASGIVNDPNDWSREIGNPRYILDLLARIVTVSLGTMEVVDALPALSILGGQK